MPLEAETNTPNRTPEEAIDHAISLVDQLVRRSESRRDIREALGNANLMVLFPDRGAFASVLRELETRGRVDIDMERQVAAAFADALVAVTRGVGAESDADDVKYMARARAQEWIREEKLEMCRRILVSARTTVRAASSLGGTPT